MVNVIPVSFSDWVHDTYLKNFNGNRSKFIEGCFVKGYEVQTGDLENQKQKILNLIKENQKLSEDLGKAHSQIGKLKSDLNKAKEKPMGEVIELD